jgi:hypothetical protein
MRSRAITSTSDWTFGKSQNNYVVNIQAVRQNIQTRLQSWLGDCWFDTGAGVNWLGYIGSKDQTAMTLGLASVILNTAGVTGLIQLSASLNDNSRSISISYQVQTVYSVTGDSFQYNLA